MEVNTQNILLTLLYFGAWALVHSFTASLLFKGRMDRLFGRFYPFYTLSYVFFSIITLGLFFFLIPEVRGLFYVVKAPFSYPLRFVQVGAGISIFLVLTQFDIGEFLGFKSVLRFFTMEPQTEQFLVTNGFYSFVRHPLYFFAIVFMWANPVVTYRYLTIISAFTLYFIIGSYFEERKLIAQFGQAYLNYRKQVPRLLPFKPLRSWMLHRHKTSPPADYEGN